MSVINDTIINVHPLEPCDDYNYNIHVEYNDFDPGKTTLVFLHGYLGNNDDYEPLKEKYSDDFNVIAMDLRGHGNSDFPAEVSWSIYDFSNDVYQVISSIVPVGNKINIIATSMATAISLQLTKDYPDLVDKLLLISPTDRFTKSIFSKLMINISKHAPDKIINTLIDIANLIYPVFIFDEERKEYVKNGFNKIKNIDIDIHRKILEETVVNWRIDASDINQKTLIIAGEDDWVVPYEDSYSLNLTLPRSTMITLPKTKHNILSKWSSFLCGVIDLWLEFDYKLLRYLLHQPEEIENNLDHIMTSEKISGLS